MSSTQRPFADRVKLPSQSGAPPGSVPDRACSRPASAAVEHGRDSHGADPAIAMRAGARRPAACVSAVRVETGGLSRHGRGGGGYMPVSATCRCGWRAIRRRPIRGCDRSASLPIPACWRSIFRLPAIGMSWKQINTVLFEEARSNRLTAEKFAYDGSHSATGGGSHIVIGGAA